MMNILRYTLISVACFCLPTAANANPVDLSTWIAEGGTSFWDVETPGNDTVLQTLNGAPAVFFDPSVTNTQGTALSGKISVQTGADDDFIGFVLGYDAGEIFSSNADFYLVDWKQEQPGIPAWDAGLSISHVTNGSNGNSSQPFPPGAPAASYWVHTPGEVDLITRARTLGNTGWVDFTENSFDIVFTSSRISVVVNGSQEIDIAPADVGVSSFTDGSFGFYNYSQAQVRYAGITQVVCTPDAPECQLGQVPIPAAAWLFGSALLGLGLVKRKKA